MIFKVLKFASKMNNNKNPKEDVSEKAERTIRNHVMWSMGAGFIPFPVADFLAVAAVQLDMIRSLSNVYDVDFKESEGKALITSLTGSGLSRVGANALIKMIPGLGSVVGGVSMSILSGASTFALGKVFKTHFETGGTILDLDTSRFKKYYDEQFEKGKKVAEDIQNEEKTKKESGDSTENTTTKKETPEAEATHRGESNSNSTENTTTPNPQPMETRPAEEEGEDKNAKIIKKLKELAELKDMGVITEEEFTKMKGKLIENYM